jgi:hypothetical protein
VPTQSNILSCGGNQLIKERGNKGIPLPDPELPKFKSLRLHSSYKYWLVMLVSDKEYKVELGNLRRWLSLYAK